MTPSNKKDRVAIQRKTFLNWVNSKIAPLKINDLSELGDGEKLTTLYENLSNKGLGKAVVSNPKSTLQKMGNLSAVLHAFQADGVRVEITGQDLVEYKETMVLGFIWVLIRKYGKVESYEYLLIALRKLCNHYGIHEPDTVNAKSFQDGLLFCAIVHSNAPREFSFPDMLEADSRTRLNKAFFTAEKALGISRMLEVDDVLNGNLDSDSIVTYISNFNLKLENLPNPTSGPAPVDTTNWEALYKEENQKVISLQKLLAEANDKIELLDVRLTNSEEAREKLEDEIESLRVALRQAAGNVVDAASEIDRLREEHNRKLEQLRAAEEEKERELATLRQESRALEEEKMQAVAKLEELNQRILNDEKQLSDLAVTKKHLESEIEALHQRLEDKDQSQTTLVAQSEELRSVLAGLMGQLEVVAREEQTVKTRKKGSDKERDTIASQMERLLKEKKEIEKKHDKAMKELERTKKNRDAEIKKLKKRIEEVQRASVMKMDTSEKDKEIEKLQKLVDEAQQREVERKKGTEEALRNFAASLEEANNAKAPLEKEIDRLRKEVERLEAELERLTSPELDEEAQKQLEAELEKMKQEYDAQLEEFRQAEEEKNKELERLKKMSEDLETQKNSLEAQLNEMSAQYTNDVRLLNDLSQVKGRLEGEVDALRNRIKSMDQSKNEMVVAAEEMKQVLSGLMAQLEAVAKEESAVVGRKKGRDADKDLLSAQLESLRKEKKEMEKLNEQAQLELERIKKNRDSEIKKLKKRMEDAQAQAQTQKTAGVGRRGDVRAMEKLREEVRDLESQLTAVRGELEKRKDAQKRDEEALNQLRVQLTEVTESRDSLRNGDAGNLEEKERKWKDYEEVMTKKATLYARDVAHYKERKEYYKNKYKKATGEKGGEKDKEKEKLEKEQRAKEKKERKERQRTLKKQEKEARKKEKEELRRLEKADSKKVEKAEEKK